MTSAKKDDFSGQRVVAQTLVDDLWRKSKLILCTFKSNGSSVCACGPWHNVTSVYLPKSFRESHFRYHSDRNLLFLFSKFFCIQPLKLSGISLKILTSWVFGFFGYSKKTGGVFFMPPQELLSPDELHYNRWMLNDQLVSIWIFSLYRLPVFSSDFLKCL